MPEVHGPKKGIDPNLRPEWLVNKVQKQIENARIEKKGDRFSRTKKPSCRSRQFRKKR